MNGWIKRKMELMVIVKQLIRKGWDYDDIVAMLGKNHGVARRTALEYIDSVKLDDKA